MRAVVSDIFLLLGSFFILAAAIGVFRFPDFYTRLHASTKLVTLGGVGVFVAAALTFGTPLAVSRLVLITAFFFLTAPLSAYMIARSGYLRGLPFYREAGSVDEWDACGAQAGAEDGTEDRAEDEAR